MPNGIYGLLVALVFTASISIGLSFGPGSSAELWIDACIVVSVCLTILSFVIRGRAALASIFFRLFYLARRGVDMRQQGRRSEISAPQLVLTQFLFNFTPR